jgi:hypothetical protein
LGGASRARIELCLPSFSRLCRVELRAHTGVAALLEHTSRGGVDAAVSSHVRRRCRMRHADRTLIAKMAVPQLQRRATRRIQAKGSCGKFKASRNGEQDKNWRHRFRKASKHGHFFDVTGKGMTSRCDIRIAIQYRF